MAKPNVLLTKLKAKDTRDTQNIQLIQSFPTHFSHQEPNSKLLPPLFNTYAIAVHYCVVHMKCNEHGVKLAHGYWRHTALCPHFRSSSKAQMTF